MSALDELWVWVCGREAPIVFALAMPFFVVLVRLLGDYLRTHRSQRAKGSHGRVIGRFLDSRPGAPARVGNARKP